MLMCACSKMSTMALQSAWACILMALVGFMLALNKERFPKMGLAFSFALLTYPIVAIPGTPALLHFPGDPCQKGFPAALCLNPGSCLPAVCTAHRTRCDRYSCTATHTEMNRAKCAGTCLSVC